MRIQAGRELPIGVVEHGTHADGAGAAGDLVVEEIHAPAVREALLADQADAHRQLAATFVRTLAVAAHLRVAQEGAFIGIEVHEHLVQRHQRGQHAGAVAGGDQVAGGNHRAPGAAVDRGTHACPVHVELGGVHGGLCGQHFGIGLVGRGAALFPGFGGDGLLLGQLARTRRFAAGQAGLGAGTHQRGIGAGKLGAVAAVVDAEEHIALLHFGAFGVIDLVDIAGHARA